MFAIVVIANFKLQTLKEKISRSQGKVWGTDNKFKTGRQRETSHKEERHTTSPHDALFVILIILLFYFVHFYHINFSLTNKY